MDVLELNIGQGLLRTRALQHALRARHARLTRVDFERGAERTGDGFENAFGDRSQSRLKYRQQFVGGHNRETLEREVIDIPAHQMVR
jgi:hypothetical protein